MKLSMKLKDITTKPIYCKSCMNEVKSSQFRYLSERKLLLCDDCISQIKKKMSIKDVFGIKTMFLSEYDGIMKSWLMNFKEYGDIELAGCFLYVFLPFVKVYFQDYVFLPLPSSKNRIEKRGFSHLPEILRASGLDYLDVFISESLSEQKEKKGSHRNDDRHISLIDLKEKLLGKKVVLFDDVMTSGSTFEQSLHALSCVPLKKVKGLILMDNLNHGKIG